MIAKSTPESSSFTESIYKFTDCWTREQRSGKASQVILQAWSPVRPSTSLNQSPRLKEWCISCGSEGTAMSHVACIGVTCALNSAEIRTLFGLITLGNGTLTPKKLIFTFGKNDWAGSQRISELGQGWPLLWWITTVLQWQAAYLHLLQ